MPARRADRLLALAPVLPNARRTDRAPAGLAKLADLQLRPDNLITRSAWWTAPGSPRAAIGYLRAHVPAGLGLSQSGGEPAGLNRVSYLAEVGAASAAARLVMDVLPYSGGVAVRATAQVPPVPSARAEVPTDTSAVEIVIGRAHAAPTVRRALHGQDARKLAELINRLPVRRPDTLVCSVDLGLRDVLLFRTTAATTKVEVKVGACGWVRVDQTRFTGPEQVDEAVLAALALPSNYGR